MRSKNKRPQKIAQAGKRKKKRQVEEVQIKLLTQLPPVASPLVSLASPPCTTNVTGKQFQSQPQRPIEIGLTVREREGSGELGKAAPIVVQQLTRKRVKKFIPKNLLLCFAFFQRATRRVLVNQNVIFVISPS